VFIVRSRRTFLGTVIGITSHKPFVCNL